MTLSDVLNTEIIHAYLTKHSDKGGERYYSASVNPDILSGSIVDYEWGKIGNAGRALKQHISSDTAAGILKTTLKRKLKEGYTLKASVLQNEGKITHHKHSIEDQ